MAASDTVLDVIGLRLADLELWLDARGEGVQLSVPACHAGFMAAGTPGNGLALRVRDGPLRSTKGWRPLFFDPQTWQLWLDSAGRYVFVPSRHFLPPRQIVIDAAFRTGEVLGQFGDLPPGQAIYPLQGIEIMIFANWLASFGDLIVHASGIDDGGAGYAFVGPSGAGKSTLAGEASTGGAVIVLGEDQVILRYMAGQFLVYGTPWHTDPGRCAPGGVPLRKLFFLDRRAEEGVRPCAPDAAIERLLPDAFIPYYQRAGVARILETLSRLAQQVPCYTLSYRLGTDIMALVRDA